MPRYINSADVLHTLKSLLYETALNQDDLRYSEVFEDIAKNRVETWVDLMPSVDVPEKNVGKWIWNDSLEVFECSVCGRQMFRNIYDYCPWCGAEMRKETEDEQLV